MGCQSQHNFPHRRRKHSETISLKEMVKAKALNSWLVQSESKYGKSVLDEKQMGQMPILWLLK